MLFSAIRASMISHRLISCTRIRPFRNGRALKVFDGFGVAGPVIETDLDWRDLTIQVLVNDRERQFYPAADMILSPTANCQLPVQRYDASRW